MIGMLIQLYSFYLMLYSLHLQATLSGPGQAESTAAFYAWAFAVIVSIFSIVFYCIDAYLSLKKAFNKIHPLFNTILAFLLMGTMPMLLFVGAKPGVYAYVYSAYHVALFVLEIFSIIKQAKLAKQEKALKAAAKAEAAAQQNQAN